MIIVVTLTGLFAVASVAFVIGVVGTVITFQAKNRTQEKRGSALALIGILGGFLSLGLYWAGVLAMWQALLIVPVALVIYAIVLCICDSRPKDHEKHFDS